MMIYIYTFPFNLLYIRDLSKFVSLNLLVFALLGDGFMRLHRCNMFWDKAYHLASFAFV